MNKKNAIIIGIPLLSVLILILTLVGALQGNAQDDAQYLRQQALELRNKARRADCQKIATRITACYSGDDGACLRMHDSIAWFSSEYGEAPELSCPNEELPFGERVGE